MMRSMCALLSVLLLATAPVSAGDKASPKKGGNKYVCADGSHVPSPADCEEGNVAMASLTSGGGVTYQDQYKNSLAKAQSIEPFTEFGDSISLRDGGVSFKNVDIELLGTGPTIRIIRTALIQDGQGMKGGWSNNLGDWGLEIPRIKTITALPDPALRAAPLSADSPIGWQVPGADKNARCTNMSIPADVRYPTRPAEFYVSEWWAGYQLVDNDGNDEPLLMRASTLPNPSQPIGTKSNWIISCLSATANPAEAPGEAFLATAPDGTRYWFNYLAYDGYEPLIKDFPNLPPKNYTYTYSLPRQFASMLVTRIEDKFGNWVTYSYSAGILTGIDASDGRQVRVTRGTNIVTITAGSAVSTRAWTYQTAVPGYSLVVTNPDGSTWKYVGAFQQGNFSNYSFYNCDQGYLSEPNEMRQVSVTGPSGATAQFNFQKKIFGRSYAPKYCHQYSFPEEITSIEEISSAVLARIWTGYALTSKVVSGPGLGSMTWSYSYSAHNGCWNPAIATYLSTSTAICNGSSPTTVWTDRVAPDGVRQRSTFSNKYDQLENKLLKEEIFAPGNSLVRATQYSYATAPTTGGNPYAFPIWVGSVLDVNGNFESAGTWAPISRVDTTQQGKTFTWQVAANCGSYVLCFDQFARPTKTIKSSTP